MIDLSPITAMIVSNANNLNTDRKIEIDRVDLTIWSKICCRNTYTNTMTTNIKSNDLNR